MESRKKRWSSSKAVSGVQPAGIVMDCFLFSAEKAEMPGGLQPGLGVVETTRRESEGKADSGETKVLNADVRMCSLCLFHPIKHKTFLVDQSLDKT